MPFAGTKDILKTFKFFLMTTKLNKKSLSANTAAENPAHSAAELLKHDRFRTVIHHLISIYVVDTRRFAAIESYLNAFYPGDENQNDLPFDGRSIFDASMLMLGISEQDSRCTELYSNIWQLTVDAIEISNKNAEELAGVILTIWEAEITKFLNSNK